MGNLLYGLTQLALFGAIAAIAFFLVKFVHSFGGDIVFILGLAWIIGRSRE